MASDIAFLNLVLAITGGGGCGSFEQASDSSVVNVEFSSFSNIFVNLDLTVLDLNLKVLT